MKENSRLTGLVLLYALLALAAYHLPWHTHPAAAFSNNAFDLAEGVSLHPDVRAETPALLTSLLLRLPLILIGLIVGLSAGRLGAGRWQWIWRAVAILVILRLNPPVDFYPFGGGSTNDRQLGYLMFGGLIAVSAIMIAARRLIKYYHLLVLVLSGTMLGVALAGFERATDIMRNRLELRVGTGGGIVIFVIISLVVGLAVIGDWACMRRAAATP